MLKLNENEKLVSWDVVVKTTNGRKLSCSGDLPYTATKRIDQTLETLYPCTWTEDNDQNCNMCKKLGENTCSNEMDGRCFEPIV